MSPPFINCCCSTGWWGCSPFILSSCILVQQPSRISCLPQHSLVLTRYLYGCLWKRERLCYPRNIAIHDDSNNYHGHPEIIWPVHVLWQGRNKIFGIYYKNLLHHATTAAHLHCSIRYVFNLHSQVLSYCCFSFCFSSLSHLFFCFFFFCFWFVGIYKKRPACIFSYPICNVMVESSSTQYNTTMIRVILYCWEYFLTSPPKAINHFMDNCKTHHDEPWHASICMKVHLISASFVPFFWTTLFWCFVMSLPSTSIL